MSPTLRSLAKQSDAELISRAKSIGATPYTGRVTDEYRVEGKPLAPDTAEVKFYITTRPTYGTGDKSVFANQLKSVTGEVINYDLKSEDGTEIDAIFGWRSVAARIVLSPSIIGTTITLLKVVGQNAVKLYEGN